MSRLKFVLRLVKYGFIFVIVAFLGWFTFFMTMALPNPARVEEPLDILNNADIRPKPEVVIAQDLIYDLDGARITIPNLETGRKQLEDSDFFAKNPFPRLEKTGAVSVSMTQGKHAMFLEQRNALYMPTPAEISYTVRVPENAALRFGVSMESRVKEAEMPPVTFKVFIDDGGGSKQIFSDVRKPEPKFPHSETDFWYHTLWKFTHIDHGFWNGKWYDYEINLAPYAGRKIRITFATASENGALSHGFVSNPRIYVPATDDKPNVIVAVMDTLRADFVGANNPEAAGLTPNIDKVAKEGVTFTNVRSYGNYSRGSFTSIFTGTPVPRLGYGQDRWSFLREEKDVYNKRHIPSIAEEFRKNGYTTVSIGNNPFVYDGSPVGAHLGFSQAIDIQREPYDTEFSTAETVRWMVNHKDERFFMMFTLNSAHSPFRPPVKYFLRGFTWQSRYLLSPQAELFRGVAGYCDDFLGKTLETLDKLGKSKNTIVVVTADHGVVLYRKQGIKSHPSSSYEWISATHTHTLYEEEVRVPMVIRYPGVIPPGGKSNRMIGLVDMAPTLTELAKIDSDEKWPGRSYADAAIGQGADKDVDDEVETAEGEQVWSMVTRTGYKYLLRGLGMARTVDSPNGTPRSIREEVYNLNKDPHETNDLSQSDPALLQTLRRLYDKMYPQHIHIHKIYARGVDKYKDVKFDITSEGRFVFLDLQKAEGNDKLQTSVREDGEHHRVVTLDHISSHVRIFFEVEPSDAKVTIKALNGDGTPLPAEAIRLGQVSVNATSNPVVVRADREHFYLDDPDRLVDERAKQDGVYIVTIPFSKWRSDASAGVKLDPELESLMRKWGYL